MPVVPVTEQAAGIERVEAHVAHGGNPLVEAIRANLPGYAPEVIFDVGANNGSVALAFAKAFPQAEIHAFEPVLETFRILTQRTLTESRIRPHNVALGRRPGRARMRIKTVSVSNRILTWRDPRKPGDEVVSVTSGDAFCAEHRIARIGLMKIDTEGHDLEVLRGFRSRLKAAEIDMVEAEVGMNPENDRHVGFERVKTYLERLGYRLFLIYEQARDTAFSGRPILRRSNVVFCSPALIEKFRRR